MLKVIQHLYMAPLLISTLLGMKTFRRNWPAPYKTFSVLLLCILFVEIMALLWKTVFYKIQNWPWSDSNLWLYNSFLIPQYLLYIAVYYQVISGAKMKRVILITGIVFTLLAIINLIFFQSIYAINSYTLIMASGIIIFLTVTYFEQLRKEKEIIRLTAHPMVWISLGAFLFHAANLPYMIGLSYLTRNNISLAIALFYVYMTLNCIMYTFYSFAFLCKHPHRK